MPRRILEGEVISNKAHKTVTVLVERRYRHPVYKKYVKRTDKYAAHDENGQFNIGDKVQIVECRPISKTKRWMVMTDGVMPAAPAAAPAKKEAKKPAAKKAAAKKTTKKGA